MVHSVVIARVHDGLPLSASVDEDEKSKEFSGDKLKSILASLPSTAAERMNSIEASSYSIHILNVEGVAFLTLCDKSYPKRLAFAFLDELQQAFFADYPLPQIEVVQRPYSFLKYESTIQRLKRSYQDIRAKQNLSRLQEELLDVSHIMTTNIKDVLERGNKLEKMSLMSDTLAAESKRYVRDARQLNLDALYRKYGAPSILIVIVIFSLWIWIKFL